MAKPLISLDRLPSIMIMIRTMLMIIMAKASRKKQRVTFWESGVGIPSGPVNLHEICLLELCSDGRTELILGDEVSNETS